MTKRFVCVFFIFYLYYSDEDSENETNKSSKAIVKFKYTHNHKIKRARFEIQKTNRKN